MCIGISFPMLYFFHSSLPFLYFAFFLHATRLQHLPVITVEFRRHLYIVIRGLHCGAVKHKQTPLEKRSKPSERTPYIFMQRATQGCSFSKYGKASVDIQGRYWQTLQKTLFKHYTSQCLMSSHLHLNGKEYSSKTNKFIAKIAPQQKKLKTPYETKFSGLNNHLRKEIQPAWSISFGWISLLNKIKRHHRSSNIVAFEHINESFL